MTLTMQKILIEYNTYKSCLNLMTIMACLNLVTIMPCMNLVTVMSDYSHNNAMSE
jgi:hypothetical protein